jgi:hypothetical protein
MKTKCAFEGCTATTEHPGIDGWAWLADWPVGCPTAATVRVTRLLLKSFWSRANSTTRRTDMTDDINASAMENRARRAAVRVGLKAIKSRWRRGTIDNRGGFQILDPYTNVIVEGERFDLTAEDVIGLYTSKGGG